MAFQIDLNELPISSPREAGIAAFSGGVSVCVVCRKEVSGYRTEARTAEQRKEFRCFSCLLKNGGRARKGLDINALPDNVAEGNADVGVPVSSSFGGDGTARNPISVMEVDNAPSTSGASNLGFHGRHNVYDGANSSESPYMIYLQTLKDYIEERSGFLGEGWRVEFEYCNKAHKTSAMYISPDGKRLKSKEDVAHYLGLRGDSPASTSATIAKKPDAFPYQFQDFYLLSAGTIDRRSTYHNNDHIWPLGYRSAWHDRITGSLFVCDVADGGDSGPIFRVQRHSCTAQSMPSVSTILSRRTDVSSNGIDQEGKDDPTTFQAVDDSISTITMLNLDSPPSLDSILPYQKIEEEIRTPEINVSSESEALAQRKGNLKDGAAWLSDIIGDFQVEARSTVAAWEKVSQAVLSALYQAEKQKGAIMLFCGHDACCTGCMDMGEPLSRFSQFDGISIIPPSIQNESEFSLVSDMLLAWLNQDRFGLDADFVLEILEKIPGIEACAAYKPLVDRRDGCGLQTVGSDFLQAETAMGSALGIYKKSLHQGEIEDIERREPCPPGKQLSLRLPSYLLGDALQVWENASCLSEILGLDRLISFQEFEAEVIGRWFDCDTRLVGDAALSGSAFLGGSNARLLARIFGSLLQLLVGELLSKASAYVCPDVGEPKSRRGRKKDLDFLDALKTTKLDILPVNVLTWHEIARRYILSVLCMEGVIDSGEIATRESGKVFHCLRGDGGTLCGSLTGVATFEGDAVILGDSMREIFGSSKRKNETIAVRERVLNLDGPNIVQGNEVGGIPEWAQVLEPVRKLPTNVGARIRRCIYEAMEKNPPEWAKEILQHSISKEVYKGNASGPTKRAVVSLLDRVNGESPAVKPEKKEKLKIETSLDDLILKQCRVVLRNVSTADEEKVFCNLLGRIVLSPNANYDEGLLGYPAMVSRPLDFRTIDLKLAAGAYWSHEAFVDDVREVWRNIRTAYGDRADLVDLAEELSQKFEDLYVNEVLSLVHKLSEVENVEDASSDAHKEREELVANISKSPLPPAPWEEGLCKVCGMDKDDDNVLLCDKCDSEYHRYCLNPPLLRIPEGNWYCPSCLHGGSASQSWPNGSVTNQIRKNSHQGRFMSKFLDGLAHLVNLLEIKEYWEFSLEERVFFMKFLFDEALNTATVRDHMEKCGTRSGELQQKMRALSNDLRILKSKEDFMALSKEDALCSSEKKESSRTPSSSDRSSSKDPDRGNKNEVNIANQPPINGEGSTSDVPSAPASLTNEPLGQENRLKIRSDISNLQHSIVSTESELLSVSLRKELLGRDSNGRAYWVFYSPRARPWIVANGCVSPKARRIEEFASIPGYDRWMSYDSDGDIEKLVKWLNPNNTKEKVLRDSILNLQLKKSKDSEYKEQHILSKGATDHSSPSCEKPSSSALLATKAMASLEGKFGLASGRMRRCECLELLVPSKEHCSTCHQSFLTVEELRKHSSDNCKAASVSRQRNEGVSRAPEDTSKRKKLKISHDKHTIVLTGPLPKPTNDRKIPGPSAVGSSREPECPFKFEEIVSRFVVSNSVQNAVNEIGLIGSGGVPTLVPSRPSHLPQISSLSNKPSPKSTESETASEGRTVDKSRSSSSSTKSKSSLLGLTKSSIVRGSSLRPLADRACDVLRLLKTNVLDMECALPQEALRASRMNEDRRREWRAYVKSAKSIYEMVQAVIVLEDAIKSEYLNTDWWYWSSPSTAAKISTLSALALRIYALDSAISYDQPFTTNANMDQTTVDNDETRSQKMSESDAAETPRSRTRASKRRKE